MKLTYGGKEDLVPKAYLATCISYEDKFSKAGNSMVELTFLVDGVRVKDYFSDKTPKFKVNQLAASLGLDTETEDPQTLEMDALFMLQKVVEVQIVNEEYNGKLRPKIESYLPIGTLPPF
jgi:anion-transporting  ArsA/GET3 family ATPase